MATGATEATEAMAIIMEEADAVEAIVRTTVSTDETTSSRGALAAPHSHRARPPASAERTG